MAYSAARMDRCQRPHEERDVPPLDDLLRHALRYPRNVAPGAGDAVHEERDAPSARARDAAAGGSQPHAAATGPSPAGLTGRSVAEIFRELYPSTGVESAGGAVEPPVTVPEPLAAASPAMLSPPPPEPSLLEMLLGIEQPPVTVPEPLAAASPAMPSPPPPLPEPAPGIAALLDEWERGKQSLAESTPDRVLAYLDFVEGDVTMPWVRPMFEIGPGVYDNKVDHIPTSWYGLTPYWWPIADGIDGLGAYWHENSGHFRRPPSKEEAATIALRLLQPGSPFWNTVEGEFGRLSPNEMAALMDVAWMGNGPFTSVDHSAWRAALHAFHAIPDTFNAAEVVIRWPRGGRRGKAQVIHYFYGPPPATERTRAEIAVGIDLRWAVLMQHLGLEEDGRRRTAVADFSH